MLTAVSIMQACGHSPFWTTCCPAAAAGGACSSTTCAPRPTWSSTRWMPLQCARAAAPTALFRTAPRNFCSVAAATSTRLTQSTCERFPLDPPLASSCILFAVNADSCLLGLHSHSISALPSRFLTVHVWTFLTASLFSGMVLPGMGHRFGCCMCSYPIPVDKAADCA